MSDSSIQFGKTQPDRKIETTNNTAPKNDQDQADAAQNVKVKALRTFHQEANMTGKMLQPGDEFSTTRQRAAELRANGLVEYTDAKHGADIHGSETDKAITDRVKQREEADKIPENMKTKPLRNPALKYANVPDEK